VTGKIKWGETIEEGASRELFEETGISGVTKLVGIKHKMDYNDAGVLLEDKYFMVVKVIKTTGELQAEFEGGKNQWMTRDEIKKLPDLFDGVEESIQMTENNKLEISETKYKVKKY
jgi:ADP-ribose pyrophosphatase YjhB (NUDIX family)